MEQMESLGDILRRLQHRNTFASTDYPVDLIAEEPVAEPCPLCGGRGWVRDDLPVGHEGFGKAFPCQCQAQATAEQRLTRLWRFSNIGRLAQVTFDATLPEGRGGSAEGRSRFRTAFDAAQAYAAEPSGWFTLTGVSGTGKTHLAAAIANRCMEHGVPVFFALVPDLLDHLRGTFGSGGSGNEFSYDELFEQVKGVPLLVLDDLGVQSSTPWAEEKLFQVLNHRYVNDLPTVVTTNVSLDHMDPRMQSRLADPRTSVVLELGAAGGAADPRIGTVEPRMLAEMSFESFDQRNGTLDREAQETLAAAATAARSFAQDPQGWLVLLGDSGCGKTHLAVAVANERLMAGQSVFFAFVPDLLDHLRYTFNPESRVTYDELFEQVKRSPLLVLDDLGAESSTPWAHEKLYQIIVHRHNAKLPTIVTTRKFSDKPQDPVASRINDPKSGTVVAITASDYRQQARRATPRGRSRNAESALQGE